MATHERKTIDLEQGWEFMQKGIIKLKYILEGQPEPQFSSEDYVMLYTTIYNMCTQKPPHDYSHQLYEKYKDSFEEYITSTVQPSLREKHDEFLLRELVKRWLNHKVMVRWLSHFFHYLDRYFIARRSLPALNEVGLTCFRQLVYEELKSKVRDAVIFLIYQEREGEQIDKALLKNVLDIFVEIRLGNMDCYENDFEDDMLKDTASYYSRKASSWILEDSCQDYMLKAEECLKREKDRASHYLHSSSEPKLLERVQNELLSIYASQLFEKEHSGCHALLRDDKVYDLMRMYRFSKITKSLEPVSQIFKQHVTAEGTALVKLVENAASNRRAPFVEGTLIGALERSEGIYAFSDGREAVVDEETKTINAYDYRDKFVVASPRYKVFFAGTTYQCLHLIEKFKELLSDTDNPTYGEVKAFLSNAAKEFVHNENGRCDLNAHLMIVKSDVVGPFICIWKFTSRQGPRVVSISGPYEVKDLVFWGSGCDIAENYFRQHYDPSMTSDQVKDLLYEMYLHVAKKTWTVGGFLKVQFWSKEEMRWELLFTGLLPRLGEYRDEKYEYIFEPPKEDFKEDFIG